jgi:hypothetical protein
MSDAIFRGYSGEKKVTDLSQEEREWYPLILETLTAHAIPFTIMGGWAQYFYSGFWKGPLKDLDLAVLPSDKDRTIAALGSIGMTDLFPKKKYQRHWIYRSTHGNLICDVIWQMPNDTGEVTAEWFSRSIPVTFLGRPARVITLPTCCGPSCLWFTMIGVIGSTPLTSFLVLTARSTGTTWLISPVNTAVSFTPYWLSSHGANQRILS